MVIGKNNRETTPPHQRERMANATENNRETKPPHHTREREGATQRDVHFLTTEQGIQYTFVSTPAKSKRCDPWAPGPRKSVASSVAMSFGSRQRRATERSLTQSARNAAATEHSDVCQPGVHKY